MNEIVVIVFFKIIYINYNTYLHVFDPIFKYLFYFLKIIDQDFFDW